MKGDTFGFVVAWVFFGFGVLCLLSLLHWAWSRWHRRGRTMGLVVDVQMLPGVQGTDIAPHVYYRPIVRYTVQGQDYNVAGGYLIQESTTRVSVRGNEAKQYETKTMPLRYRTGQTMDVIYDRTNPGQAELIDRRRELQIIVLQTFVGVIFVAIGMMIFLLNGNLAWLGESWQR